MHKKQEEEEEGGDGRDGQEDYGLWTGEDHYSPSQFIASSGSMLRVRVGTRGNSKLRHICHMLDTRFILDIGTKFVPLVIGAENTGEIDHTSATRLRAVQQHRGMCVTILDDVDSSSMGTNPRNIGPSHTLGSGKITPSDTSLQFVVRRSAGHIPHGYYILRIRFLSINTWGHR